MGSAYTIFGKTVQPHVLAIATIAATVGGTVFSMSGSGAEEKPKAAPTSAQDSGDLDIEKVLDNYLQKSEKN